MTKLKTCIDYLILVFYGTKMLLDLIELQLLTCHSFNFAPNLVCQNGN